jgi:hypothetical protein
MIPASPPMKCQLAFLIVGIIFSHLLFIFAPSKGLRRNPLAKRTKFNSKKNKDMKNYEKTFSKIINE